MLWIKKLRTSPLALFFISGVILVGMWLERFIIVVVSLHRDFLTSSWGMYYPTRWDWMTYIGTIGMFLMLMFLFLRILPAISIFEMRTLLPEAEVKRMKRDPIYGIMAEFDSAQALVDAAHRTHEAGYKKIDAYSPFPIEGLAEEIGFHHDEVPLVVLDRRHHRRPHRLPDAVLDVGRRLSAQHRRQAASFLARVHRHHFRDDDSVRRNLRRLRHVGAEWPAHALSPGI